MLHAGWDYLTSEPGEHAAVHCRVCGEPMLADRNVVIATGWAHAMAVHAGEMAPVRRDAFHCQFAQAGWHEQALALRQQAAETPGVTLAAVLTAEADEVVRTRTRTKPPH